MSLFNTDVASGRTNDINGVVAPLSDMHLYQKINLPLDNSNHLLQPLH